MAAVFSSTLPGYAAPAQLDRRQRYVLVGLAAVLMAGAGAFAWSRLHRAPAEAASLAARDASQPGGAAASGRGQLMPVAARKSVAAGPAAAAGTFEESCLKPIRLKRFSESIEACGRFVDVPDKAGHAHAALAAIYATRSYINVAASVRHAQAAADAGDARGKFMVAYHMLTGVASTPFDLDRTRALLEESKAGGVRRAQQYIEAIDASMKCREQATFRLFEQPLFCLFRPEVTQLLVSKGMTERHKDLEQWIDSYRPGEVLLSSDSATAIYDRDPQEELQRLARFSYRFPSQEGVDRLKLLRTALMTKYGDPAKLNAKAAQGGDSLWQLPDGVRIGLEADEDGNVVVTYTQPARWEARDAHLKREAELMQNALLTRDQLAL